MRGPVRGVAEACLLCRGVNLRFSLSPIVSLSMQTLEEEHSRPNPAEVTTLICGYLDWTLQDPAPRVPDTSGSLLEIVLSARIAVPAALVHFSECFWLRDVGTLALLTSLYGRRGPWIDSIPSTTSGQVEPQGSRHQSLTLRCPVKPLKEFVVLLCAESDQHIAKQPRLHTSSILSPLHPIMLAPNLSSDAMPGRTS